MFVCFVGFFCCLFSSKKGAWIKRELSEMGKGFFDLGSECAWRREFERCGRKQRKERGLWEAAAPAGRSLSRSESRREEKGKEICGGQSFPGPRGHSGEFTVAHNVLNCLKL